jgi:hypothetical protein
MRFNSPPNWPAPPPGWTPPPDWRPDPSWPPPPPGWQVWVDDAPRSNKKGLIIGGIAAALVLIIGAVLAVSIFTKDSPQVTVSKPTSTNDKAENEKQIEDVVEKFQDAWNDSDFDAFKPIVCKDAQQDSEFNEKDFLDSREGSEKLDLNVTDVDIDGDDATVTVENDNKDPDDIAFTREDGEWKWCDF